MNRYTQLISDVRWITNEVTRQDDFNQASVMGMTRALAYARQMARYPHASPPMMIDESAIIALGSCIKPVLNSSWRITPVYFADMSVAIPPGQIQQAMSNLVSAWEDGRIDKDSFYQEFLEIHPFVDGNGRVASLLWNMMNGTINDPVTPPEFRKGNE